jgi:hypothetical protein
MPYSKRLSIIQQATWRGYTLKRKKSVATIPLVWEFNGTLYYEVWMTGVMTGSGNSWWDEADNLTRKGDVPSSLHGTRKTGSLEFLTNENGPLPSNLGCYETPLVTLYEDDMLHFILRSFNDLLVKWIHLQVEAVLRLSDGLAVELEAAVLVGEAGRTDLTR